MKVKLLKARAHVTFLRSCSCVGPGLLIQGRPHVENFGRIDIGADFRLSSRGVQSHLVTGPQGLLRIGNHVAIDFGAAIASYTAIMIGDRVRIGPFVMVMDTDFHATVSHTMLLDGEPITIGDDVRIGTRVTVLKGTTIGAGATVLAGSVVRGVIPPGQVVSGVPARPIPPSTPPN